MKAQILSYFSENFGLEGAEALEMFVAYLDALENHGQKLTELASGEDAEAYRHVFHTVKGCALNCGDTEMSGAALAAEQCAKCDEIDACRNHADAIFALMRARLSER